MSMERPKTAKKGVLPTSIILSPFSSMKDSSSLFKADGILHIVLYQQDEVNIYKLAKPCDSVLLEL